MDFRNLSRPELLDGPRVIFYLFSSYFKFKKEIKIKNFSAHLFKNMHTTFKIDPGKKFIKSPKQTNKLSSVS